MRNVQFGPIEQTIGSFHRTHRFGGESSASQADGIDAAVKALLQGQTVALPTETVYGLAADATNESAVKNIFVAKARPLYDPLIVHVAASDDVISNLVEKKIVDSAQISQPIRDKLAAVAQKFWPGPLTVLLPKGEGISDLITAGSHEVAIRVPNHPVFQAVLKGCKRGRVV